MREELEWPLVDILQATSRLGLLLSSVGGGVRLSPVSAGEKRWWGGRKGRRGGGRLKSLPGNASTSTIEQGETAHNEGKIRWR